MSPNRRIVLNFIATYGRSLYLLVVGLLCGRWKLQILGEVDFGLYGLVGGLTILISFFNNLMADAVSRFYAYAVGQSKVEEDGVEICRKWFNTAVLIHTTLPVVFLAVGYPAGVWTIKFYLTIPSDRIHDCIWVWRFVCASCFLGMISVPFSAMYKAKQYIAELTIYSFVTATLNIAALYYMLKHPGSWLVGISFWMCLLSILPQLIIAVRAYAIFPECQFNRRYLLVGEKLRSLFIYAGYRLIGAVSSLTRVQLMVILVNKMLGPARNASMTTANILNNNAMTFGASLEGALAPAITNALGSRDLGRVKNLVVASCRFSAGMSLLFVLPLLCLANEVLDLWLGNPPIGSADVCKWLMLCSVLQSATSGHYLLIYASGNIRGYEIANAVIGLIAFPAAWLFMCLGFDVQSVGIGLMIAWVFMILPRLYYGRKIVGELSVRHWFTRIFLLYFLIGIFSCGVGLFVKALLDSLMNRLFVVTCCVDVIFAFFAWNIVFDAHDRAYVKTMVIEKISRFTSRR